MGWEIEVLRKCVSGFAEPMTFEKVLWDTEQTEPGLASPLLISVSQFSRASVYHVLQREPPLVCSFTLNYLQFLKKKKNFFFFFFQWEARK